MGHLTGRIPPMKITVVGLPLSGFGMAHYLGWNRMNERRAMSKTFEQGKEEVRSCASYFTTNREAFPRQASRKPTFVRCSSTPFSRRWAGTCERGDGRAPIPGSHPRGQP